MRLLNGCAHPRPSIRTREEHSSTQTTFLPPTRPVRRLSRCKETPTLENIPLRNRQTCTGLRSNDFVSTPGWGLMCLSVGARLGIVLLRLRGNRNCLRVKHRIDARSDPEKGATGDPFPDRISSPGTGTLGSLGLSSPDHYMKTKLRAILIAFLTAMATTSARADDAAIKKQLVGRWKTPGGTVVLRADRDHDTIRLPGSAEVGRTGWRVLRS
jgi:hypothetical protein